MKIEILEQREPGVFGGRLYRGVLEVGETSIVMVRKDLPVLLEDVRDAARDHGFRLPLIVSS